MFNYSGIGGDNFRNVGRFRVTRMIMQETGTYNPMFSRPYYTDMNGGVVESIASRVSEFGVRGIQPIALNNVALNFLKPTATPQAEIAIPYGWQERRIRFIMEVQVDYNTGTTVKYFLQGYTDFPGVSQQGHVAPEMAFIINSLIGVTQVNLTTPYGGTQITDKVIESSQILVENRLGNNIHNNQKFMMRPQDIFVGMHSAYLQQSYNVDNQSDFVDARYLMRSEPVQSNRSNNVSANYLAKVIDSNTYGREIVNYGSGTGDILTRARSTAMEPQLLDNPVIRRLSELSGGMGVKNIFTFSDFEKLDPNISNVTDFITLGSVLQIGQANVVHEAGQTEYWVGSDLITQQATIISHSIPALMMEMMISKIMFTSTNHTLNCSIDTRIIDAMSLTSADLRQNYDLFLVRLEREILMPMCFNGQESFSLEMNIDMFGETWINLSIGNSPSIQFVIPSFCDTLCSPVVTQSMTNFETLVSDFETMLGNVSHAQEAVVPPTMSFNRNV